MLRNTFRYSYNFFLGCFLILKQFARNFCYMIYIFLIYSLVFLFYFNNLNISDFLNIFKYFPQFFAIYRGVFYLFSKRHSVFFSKKSFKFFYSIFKISNFFFQRTSFNIWMLKKFSHNIF